MDEKLNRVYARVSVVETRLEEVEKLIKKYETEKQQLENELNDLCEKEELIRGENFANECKEGKHPIVNWNDMPKFMKMHFHDMFQENLDNLEIKSALGESKVLDKTITQFKKLYRIEHFEILKTSEEINNKLFENLKLT